MGKENGSGRVNIIHIMSKKEQGKMPGRMSETEKNEDVP